MKRYMVLAIIVAGGLVFFWVKIPSPQKDFTLAIPTSPAAHFTSTKGRRDHGVDHAPASPSVSDLTKDNLDRLLSKSDLELNRILDGLTQVQASSILNAFGRKISTDISSRGDYTLANRLIVGLEHGNSAKILQWVLQSKSPLGCEFDFREQTSLVSKFSNGNPSNYLRGNFLKNFGSLQGEDAARSGTTFPLSKSEYLSYIDGVCKSSRETTFENLVLIRDMATLEMAVERAVTSLLTADAVGFSEYLRKVPASDTKDLAILQMIKWLSKENASSECAPWLEVIHSPTIKIKAFHVIEGDASDATNHSRE